MRHFSGCAASVSLREALILAKASLTSRRSAIILACPGSLREEEAQRGDVRDQRELARLVLKGEDRVARQTLVDHHTDDAHHRGAAVVALGVELELAHCWVRVAHPRDA